MLLRASSAIGAFAIGALAAAFVVGPPTLLAATPLAIIAEPVALDSSDPGRQQVGQLRYLGGLALRSPNRAFGGISAAQWDAACNRLLAVTDTGAWAVLAPIEANGRLVGVGAAHLAAILDQDGAPPASKAMADAEALSHAANGDTLVWFERQNRAQRYRGISACAPETLARPAVATLAPPDMAGWPENGGPEAASRFHDGQLVFAEEARAPDGGFLGLILAADGSTRARVSLGLPDGYRPTGLALLDEAADGQSARYIMVSRQFSALKGVSARVLLLTVPAAGGRVAATELAQLKPPLTVDNMEAIAIRKDFDRTILYLLSDDNFNPMQRTLLLQFQWVAPPS